MKDMVQVLVVEDSPTQAARLCADLASFGFEVSLARSGAEALQLLEQHTVDVIASDVVMPGMNGYELCRRVKDDPRFKDVPVVLLTSLTDPLDVVNGLESGADNFIRKPYEPGQLVARLRAAVANRELRQSGRLQVGIQLSFLDREFDITADRQQILDLLISTFEELVLTSRAVRQREQELETAHAELQEQLALVDLERQRLRAVVDAVPVPLFVTAPDGTVSFASEASGSALQLEPTAVLGRMLEDVLPLLDADGRPISPEALPHRRAAETGQGSTSGEAFDLFLSCPAQAQVPVVVQASPIVGPLGRSVGSVTTVLALGGLSAHDPITGLPNAAAFLDQAAIKLDGQHGRAGLLLVELDRFDAAQANFSGATGNDIVTQVSRRLRQIFEPSSGPSSSATCLLSYLGGHRFGVLLTNLPDPFRVVHLAEAARRAILSEGSQQAGMRITASVGAALDDGDQGGPQLFAAASEALRQAHEVGGNRVEVFAPSAAKEAMERLQLEIALRAAVEAGEVTLDYQPEYSLLTGQVIGFEALARWRHPKLGLVAPSVFIPLAEQSGLITKLGGQVLRQACREAASWGEFEHGDALTVSVNVSTLQLTPELIEEVGSVLAETGLEAARLVLEVTETAALSDPAKTVPIIEELRRLGVRFALDDFGTGYSSLSQLTQIHFDQLKLDRSFVTAIAQEGRDAIIARSVIGLGRSLGTPVVAEGVETTEQLQALQASGCDYCQGYLFSKPLPVDAVRPFLESALAADVALVTFG